MLIITESVTVVLSWYSSKKKCVCWCMLIKKCPTNLSQSVKWLPQPDVFWNYLNVSGMVFWRWFFFYYFTTTCRILKIPIILQLYNKICVCIYNYNIFIYILSLYIFIIYNLIVGLHYHLILSQFYAIYFLHPETMVYVFILYHSTNSCFCWNPSDGILFKILLILVKSYSPTESKE